MLKASVDMADYKKRPRCIAWPREVSMALEEYGVHIEQQPREISLCTGCHSCEMMCSLSHDGVVGVSRGRIQVELDSVKSMMYTVYACQQCADHPCYDACPKKDSAMCIDENGIVYIQEEACIGCGKCMRSCKFTPSRIVMPQTKDRKQRKAKKCDLCRGRKEGPVCIEHCSACVLHLSQPAAAGKEDSNHDV